MKKSLISIFTLTLFSIVICTSAFANHFEEVEFTADCEGFTIKGLICANWPVEPAGVIKYGWELNYGEGPVIVSGEKAIAPGLESFVCYPFEITGNWEIPCGNGIVTASGRIDYLIDGYNWDNKSSGLIEFVCPCECVCDDGDPCTIDECVNNQCVHTPKDCDDRNLCTSDQCVDGECVYTEIVCNDDDLCTSDQCVRGECVYEPAVVCDDDDVCTDDACNPETGQCEYTDNGTCDYEGCTPGYWKQVQHFDSWVSYLPGNKFSDVFGCPITIRGHCAGRGRPAVIVNPTLLQALWANGGGCNALARHAVAALLNAASSGVNYKYEDIEAIKTMVCEAIENGCDETVKDELADQNEMGCPLN